MQNTSPDHSGTAPFCYITAIPEHVLFDIFEYIQPLAGPVMKVPLEASPVHRKEDDGLPYEVLLAQVCKTFRATALELRQGNCLDVSSYVPRSLCKPPCPSCPGGADGFAYDVFFDDPCRVKWVRTLSFLSSDKTKNQLFNAFSVYKTLLAVDLSQLHHFQIDDKQGTVVDSGITAAVSREFVKAACKRPLQMRTLKFQQPPAYNLDEACILWKFLCHLQNAPLRELILEFPSTHERDPIRFSIPANILFKSLQTLTTTPYILFDDWAVSLPNLESLEIKVEHPFSPMPQLKTLTQPTLRHFGWKGQTPGPLRQLALSPTICRQLTSVTIISLDDSNENQIADLAQPFLSQLHNLRTLQLGDEIISHPSDDVGYTLSHIPGKVQTLHATVLFWKYSTMRANLVGCPALKEVCINVRRGPLAVIQKDAVELSEELQIPTVHVKVWQNEEERKICTLRGRRVRRTV
ncbi:hypothetical protein HDV00_004421 [Rhizophlyctis rosea]|nr:hypothetical protein HDV00_004421 [Rhizophlyctis rosea]